MQYRSALLIILTNFQARSRCALLFHYLWNPKIEC